MLQLPRIYPILDTALLQTRGISPLAAATELVAAGAQILQFRHKGEYTSDVFDMASQIGDVCRTASIPLVINDRADIARMITGAWLHVGQEDLTVDDARAVTGPDSIIGVSTHDERQLLDACATAANYIAIGPIFPTASKQNPDAVLGVEQLATIRESADWVLAGRSLVAIGGITIDTAPSVWRAGADSVAVIGALFPEQSTSVSLRERFAEWLAASVLS